MLIRSIASLARWDGTTVVNRPDATIAGDVISDLRTQSNTLSVWRADTQEDINDAIIAMSLNRTDVSKMIALLLDENDLPCRLLLHPRFREKLQVLLSL